MSGGEHTAGSGVPKAPFSRWGIRPCRSEILSHLLQTYGIACVADIRTVPRSRHNPQFNGDTLGGALKGEEH